MGRPFIYRCPTTGMNVQGWTDDDHPADGDDNRYQMVTCLACRRFHFVNPFTGKQPSEKDE